MDWSSLLLADSTVVLPLPRDPRVPPYTRVTALDAGWMWQMSLSDRVACGYVYASKYCSEEAAARELMSRASPHKAAAAEPRFAKTRTGRRQSFWLKNCVALGPAAGAALPLHAMDFILLVRALELLVEYFPDQTINPVLSRAYNQRIAAQHDMVRDFHVLHYLLSRRADQPFWNDSKNVAVPESLQTILELHGENGCVDPASAALVSEGGYHHLFAAAQRLPRRPRAAADAVDFNQVIDILGKMRAQNETWLAKMPPHRDVMEALHRPVV
jgi:tryptophan halogenase